MPSTFTCQMKVRDYECDSQGVVNNANYLHYFEHARHEMLESCGIRLKDLTAQNILPVVRRADIQYKQSLRGSDQFVCYTQIRREGIRYIFDQQIIRTPDNTLCCIASIQVVTLVNGKLSKPQLFDEAFATYL